MCMLRDASREQVLAWSGAKTTSTCCSPCNVIYVLPHKSTLLRLAIDYKSLVKNTVPVA